MSHSTVRAKRAKFTFWVAKSLLKMQKMVNFGEFFITWSLRPNSVTRQVNFKRSKIGGNAEIEKFKCDILIDFQTMWTWQKRSKKLQYSCYIVTLSSSNLFKFDKLVNIRQSMAWGNNAWDQKFDWVLLCFFPKEKKIFAAWKMTQLVCGFFFQD